MKRRLLFLASLLTFQLLPLFASQIKTVSPIPGIDWTFETTMGIQRISNPTMTNEGGSDSQSSRTLNFYGVLFNAYFFGVPLVKAQMNLGFNRTTQFAWTEHPDFTHDERLNESLCCIEIDAQINLPFRIYAGTRLLPFVGYSFIEYTFDENFSTSSAYSYMYNTFVFGIEYYRQVSRLFSQKFYAACSPFLLSNNDLDDDYRYLNLGAELKINSYPVALTFFCLNKRAFKQQESLFEDRTYILFTTDLGLSFRMNL